MATDTLGHFWVSLTQVNTTSKVFCLYLRELVKALDKERSGWRKSTVLTFDGASYHRTAETNDMLRTLNVPTMVLAPHSYAVAACELVFAALKDSHLNPEQLPTGKT